MTEQQDVFEKIVLDEVEGKNRAVHAYDASCGRFAAAF